MALKIPAWRPHLAVFSPAKLPKTPVRGRYMHLNCPWERAMCSDVDTLVTLKILSLILISMVYNYIDFDLSGITPTSTELFPLYTIPGAKTCNTLSPSKWCWAPLTLTDSVVILGLSLGRLVLFPLMEINHWAQWELDQDLAKTLICPAVFLQAMWAIGPKINWLLLPQWNQCSKLSFIFVGAI